MSKNSAIVLSLIAAVVLFTTSLSAQGPGGFGGQMGPGGQEGQRGPGGPGGPGGKGGQQSPLLKYLDTNGDGKLSSDEIAAAPKNLLKADINGDGVITLDELQGPPEAAIAGPDDLTKQLMSFDKTGKGYLVPGDLPARMQAMFTRGDTNHDGKLTPEEIHALALKQTLPTGTQKMQTNDLIFLALDLNHDGTIDASEIAAASKSLLTLDKNHDGEISAAEMRPPQQTPADQAAHMLGENDINKDGKISRDEAPDFLKGQFDTIDTNHDGFLDLSELTAFFAKQGPGRGGPGGQGQGDGQRQGMGQGQGPGGQGNSDGGR